MRNIITTLFYFLSVLIPAYAQEFLHLSPEEWIVLQVSSNGGDIVKLRSDLTSKFTESDLDEGGISTSDYNVMLDFLFARNRINTLDWLRYDLNGDLALDANEIAIMPKLVLQIQYIEEFHVSHLSHPTVDEIDAMAAHFRHLIWALDIDHNGVVAINELVATTSSPSMRELTRAHMQMVPLSFDADGDDIVSLAEFEQAIDRALKAMDTNGDGSISDEETRAIKGKRDAIIERLQSRL